METQDKKLGTAPIGALLFSLAVPAITAQLVNMLYNMVDRIYIANIPVVGTDALTGVSVCLPLIMLISAFAALVSMGGAPRASIAIGRGNAQEANRIMGNCFTLLIALSVVITIVFSIFQRDLLLRFGASENTIGYAADYMRIYTLGTIFVQLALGMNAFITAQGFAKTSMLTVLIGAILNTLLDPLFIFVFGMGVRGAALATVLSQAVSAIWVVAFLSGGKSPLRLSVRHMRLNFKVVGPCIALGLSPFIMQATESLIAVCFNSSLASYGGDLAVGSMSILTSVMQFSMLPLLGLTQGSQPIISYNFGARNAARVKAVFKLLLRACVIYSTALWFLVMTMPQVFARIITPDPALIEFCTWALRVYMAVSLVFGVQLACQQTFIALGNAVSSLILAVLRKIILLVPLIYILPLVFPTNKVMAVFLAEPVADFVAVCTTAILFSVQFKKALKKLDEPAPVA